MQRFQAPEVASADREDVLGVQNAQHLFRDGARDVQQSGRQRRALAPGHAVILIALSHEPPRLEEADVFSIHVVVRDLVRIADEMALGVSAGPFLVQVDWTEADEPAEKVDAVPDLVGEIKK